MQHVLTLRKTILIFGFVLVFVGCAASKNQSTNANFGYKAEAVPEGIQLTFHNIPPDITELTVVFRDSNTVDYPPHEQIARGDDYNLGYDYNLTLSHIWDSALEQVKKTNTVILPFVKPGQKYFIEVFLTTEGELADWDASIKTECIPYAGIYFARDIEVALNETHTIATLSSEPVFSEEVNYASVKYGYIPEIDIDDVAVATLSSIDWDDPSNHLAFDSTTNELISDDFSPLYNLWKKNGVRGNFPAYFNIVCFIMYDNLEWQVDIAKSDWFTLSF